MDARRPLSPLPDRPPEPLSPDDLQPLVVPGATIAAWGFIVVLAILAIVGIYKGQQGEDWEFWVLAVAAAVTTTVVMTPAFIAASVLGKSHLLDQNGLTLRSFWGWQRRYRWSELREVHFTRRDDVHYAKVVFESRTLSIDASSGLAFWLAADRLERICLAYQVPHAWPRDHRDAWWARWFELKATVYTDEAP